VHSENTGNKEKGRNGETAALRLRESLRKRSRKDRERARERDKPRDTESERDTEKGRRDSKRERERERERERPAAPATLATASPYQQTAAESHRGQMHGYKRSK
jgi:hypothetical protein